MQATGRKIYRDHTTASAFFVHYQIDGKVFNIKFSIVFQRLLI